MPDVHKNFAYSRVATAPSPADSGTTLIVTAGQGSYFPTTPFQMTIWPASQLPLPTNAEIVTVTGVNGDTFTIVRKAEGTSERGVLIGDQIAATITAKTLTDAETVEPIVYKDEPLVIANGSLFSIALLAWTDADQYGDIASSDYNLEANWTAFPGSSTILNTDPFVLSTGILADLGGNTTTLFWLDAARCPTTISTLLVIGV